MNEHDKEQTTEVEEVSCDVCLKNISVSDAKIEHGSDSVAYFCGLDCYKKWKFQKSPEHSVYNINFFSGIACLCESDYKQARHFFLNAVTQTDPLEIHHNIYLSYLGLANVLLDHKNGILSHCSHSSDTSLPIEPEIQINLACAEFIKGNRSRGVQAMDELDEFILSSKSSEEIHSFFDLVGKREQNYNGSLKRNNIFYKPIGKLFRKKENIDITGYIETYIVETAKKRYKCTAFNI